jgi:ring-1,2-phenylacetyl-CoA epoxidase subunit PaaC
MKEAELSREALVAVRDLTLVLADTKRLLGYRYAEWMLGAPELETGIACSSMAQDEWGHARLLYALMKGFDDDPEALEHGRDPDAYRNMEILDSPTRTWPEVVALMALVDGAVTVQFEALRGSAYEPLAQRVEKVVDEEKFHGAHGTAWAKRLAGGTDASREALGAALTAALPAALAWFGPDSDRAAAMKEAGVVNAAGSELRARFLERVAPVLEMAGVAAPGEPEMAGFDEARRRTGSGGPDEETIRKIRGDRNRAFLMD